MGPTTASSMNSDTRGTQTDLVTDRNIADCLMELKSSAEFQDLSYRLSRSCTGEMNLIVTRDSTLGLLGAPFDPMFVTVTASGYCHVSVLFMPVEIINLRDKPNGDLNLRKFRNILWKMNGRAGYGFCPGFKENDFPEGFQFETHGLEVLRHPFTRVQAKNCQVFVQQRRSNSRAASQPLQLKLCPLCFDTLNSIFVTFKSSQADLSLAAFAKFLPYDSSAFPSQSPRSSQSKSKGAELENSKSRLQENTSAAEENAVNSGSPSTSFSNVHEAVTSSFQGKYSSKVPVDKTTSDKLSIRDCSVLLDRVSPSTAPDMKADKTAVSSMSSAPSSEIVSAVPSHLLETLPPSCTSSWSIASPTAASGSSGRFLTQVSAENSSPRPVLSARIKPFRTVMPHEKECSVLISAEEGGTDVSESGASEMPARAQAKVETSPETDPPVLTPQTALSPDSSPQPLLIDEDAEIEEVEIGTSEPEAKRLCFRCAVCEEAFSSESEIQHHFSQQHPPAVDLNSTSDSSITVNCNDTSDPVSHSEDPHQPPESKVCPICHQCFSSKDELEKHLINRHGARLHPCRYCGKKFALKKNLADHLKRHRGPEILTCQECGSKFSKKKEFAAHVREHMGSVPFFCSICSRLFSRKNTYEEHMERHRTRRGVRPVLAGNEKTKREIMSKAKKCLEEKALFNPSATITTEIHTPSAAQGVIQSPSCASLSTAVSDSVASASNLVLLSTVSLAKAEYDRQPNNESYVHTSGSGNLPSGLESNQAAAQLIHMSLGQGTVKPLNHTVTRETHPTVDAEQTPVSSAKRPEDSKVLLQGLNTSVTMPDTAAGSSKGQMLRQSQIVEHSQTNMIQDMTKMQMPIKPVSVEDPERSQHSLDSQPQSNTDTQRNGNGEQDQLLTEREQKLKQKEEELKNFTKKNMILFQQLMMAQLAQQAKTGNASGSGQGRAGRPIPPQAAAMFAALNSMARSMGLGVPGVRPPGPAKASHAGMASAANLAQSRGEASTTQSMLPNKSNSTNVAGSNIVPGAAQHTNTQHLKRAGQSGNPDGPSTILVSGSSAIPNESAQFRRPPPHSAALRASQAAAQTMISPHSSIMRQPGPASSQHGPFFLQELIKLESKMPASAKQFLPVSVRKQSPGPPMSPVLPKPAAVTPPVEVSEKSGGTTVKSKGRSGRSKGSNASSAGGSESSDSSGTEGRPRGKRGAWSGGLVKEKLNSVVTMVPPHEMQRLLALTTPPSPVAELMSNMTASPQPRPSSSSSVPSPVASQTLSSETVSSSQSRTATPAPLSSSHSSPISTSVNTSPLSTVSQASAAPSSNLLPSPQQISSSALDSSDSPRPSFLHDSSPASSKNVPEEVGPIDLTKGSSSKAVTSEKKSTNSQPTDQNTVKSKSRILRNVLLDPVVSQDMVEDIQKKVGMNERSPVTRSEVSKGTSQGDVSVPGRNSQPAALEAHMQTLVQAVQDQKILKPEGLALLQHFLPLSPASQQALSGTSQRMTLPQFSASSQLRLALPSQPVLSMQGLALPRNRIPPQNAHLPQISVVSRPLSTGTDGSSKASSTSETEGMPAVDDLSVKYVSSPLNAALSSPRNSINSGRNVPPSSPSFAPSSVGPIVMPTSTVVSAANSVSVSVHSYPTSSASSDQSNIPTPSVSSAHAIVPNFLLPAHTESNSSISLQRQKLSVQSDAHQPAVNPLGGFAWHRPAAIDPYQTAHVGEDSAASKKDRNHVSQVEGGNSTAQSKSPDEVQNDLTADQNLWQQQFLLTLREKRRQQQEQQQRQQREIQQVVEVTDSAAGSEKQPSLNKKRRRKSPAVGTKAAALASNDNNLNTTVQIVAENSGAQTQNMNNAVMQAGTTNIHPSSVISGSANTAEESQVSSGTRSRGNRARSRGKGRKKAEGQAASAADITDSGRGTQEEGAELQGFGTDVEVKIEPLEEGVRCDGCGTVFFNEMDILEHDCDGQ